MMKEDRADPADTEAVPTDEPGFRTLTDSLAESGAANLPAGVRWTTMFLDFLVFLLLVPLLAAAFACVASLTRAVHESGVSFRPYAMPLAALAAFQIVLVMAIGASWLSEGMRAGASGRGHALESYWNQHPIRIFALPASAAGEVFSIACVIAWLVVKLARLGPTSWIWLVIWLIVGIGSCSLRIRIARCYPR